jgi:hypothetical protein
MVGEIRFVSLFFFIIFFLLGNVGLGESQTPFIQDWIIPVPHPVTSLLRAEQVRHELGMTTAQINYVEQAVAGVDLPLWRLRDLPVQQRNEDAELLIRQLRKELSQILSPLQIERLNQLTWQAIGIAAVLEPEVTLKLNLSDGQIAKIRILLNSSY